MIKAKYECSLSELPLSLEDDTNTNLLVSDIDGVVPQGRVPYDLIEAVEGLRNDVPRIRVQRIIHVLVTRSVGQFLSELFLLLLRERALDGDGDESVVANTRVLVRVPDGDRQFAVRFFLGDAELQGIGRGRSVALLPLDADLR